jgi:8-oxo-dGTP pyrophosphatase MutT (NUDIX family)
MVRNSVGGDNQRRPETRPWDNFLADGQTLTIADVQLRWSAVEPKPLRRYGYRPAQIRPAAALVPVVDSHGQAAVLATKRPSTMEYHKDDWVFPGGRVDLDREELPVDAARRELEEELGIPAANVETLGHLATYGPFVTGFLLHVFVGIVDQSAVIVPNEREVVEVLALPLGRLMAPSSYFMGPIPKGHDPGPVAGEARPGRPTGQDGVRFFQVREDEYLWGTQGEILWDLLCRLSTPTKR